MYIVKPLLAWVVVCSLTVANPINLDSNPATSIAERQTYDAPRCGYVRLNEGDGWMVGIYTRGVCEVIWKEQSASIFRIDGVACACKFYNSRESCQNAEPAQAHMGPNAMESRFMDEKPKWVKCENV